MSPRNAPTDPAPDPKIDAVFAALAHHERRRMLDLLRDHPGMTVSALASHFSCSRVMVLKHLESLSRAGLVLSEKAGRSRHLFFNVIPIQQVHDRWTDEYSRFWAGRVVDLKAAVEDTQQRKESRRA